MKKIIRLTESDLHQIVADAVNRILKEDGAGGGGATNAAGVMQGGGTNPGAGQYDVPAFGGKAKKKVGGNAFSEPIMRQKHNLGDVTQAKTNQVDMGETEKRSKDFKNGSMAIQRVESKKKSR